MPSEATKWVLNRLSQSESYSAVTQVDDDLLEVELKDRPSFIVGVLGEQACVERPAVEPLFSKSAKPTFITNIPSKTIWSGAAINFIHGAPASFGRVGEISTAARAEPVSTYRNKDLSFFERCFEQHSSVSKVSRVYDRVFLLERSSRLPPLTVVLVDAYDMSAEDVRNARSTYGSFDIALKTTSYGGVTSAAESAAESMGAEAFKLREFMGRLNRR